MVGAEPFRRAAQGVVELVGARDVLRQLGHCGPQRRQGVRTRREDHRRVALRSPSWSRAFSCGINPAWTSDDLPTPEAPGDDHDALALSRLDRGDESVDALGAPEEQPLVLLPVRRQAAIGPHPGRHVAGAGSPAAAAAAFVVGTELALRHHASHWRIEKSPSVGGGPSWSARAIRMRTANTGRTDSNVAGIRLPTASR
ncbi:hypothetical protein GS439_02405 [Rhodococcus hoagii]|nr:hypothetical protein [Prescottella equi]